MGWRDQDGHDVVASPQGRYGGSRLGLWSADWCSLSCDRLSKPLDAVGVQAESGLLSSLPKFAAQLRIDTDADRDRRLCHPRPPF